MSIASRFPHLPPGVPQVRSRWRRWVGVTGLWLAGWRIEPPMPTEPKCVLIVAPHTSNWDFVMGFLAYLAMQMDASWLAKHTALAGPFGPLGRHFGGIPVDRSKPGNMVEACIDAFSSPRGKILVITPEGTRSRVEEWKRGYHRIALSAGVPIVPAAIDFKARCVRFGPAVQPTADAEADERKLRAFYRAEMAKHPSLYKE
ncbi:MAG: 1-acyl-sn-glycerol-3-phosphate acyltransferase [Gammaproteobacteria bacterium]|jgi:1-acyl-sn-glycerol-3-phosphate acyltransferase